MRPIVSAGRRLILLLLLSLYAFVACGGVYVCVEADGKTNVEWALALCCEAPASTGDDPSASDAACGGCNDVLAPVTGERPKDGKTVVPAAQPALALELADVLAPPLEPRASARIEVPERALETPLTRRPSVLRS